jgi:uncharacterized protein (DUF2147 family)
MKKTLCLLAICSQLLGSDDIVGFWKSLNDTTGMIQCVVAVYPFEGKYYGRIISTYNAEGKMKDSIYHPESRAPGVAGNPPYCGLDLIWNLEDFGAVYKGKIIDPEKGNIYNSEVWIDAGNLIIRGKLLFFGRSTTWYPVSKDDFPPKFKMPDVSKFIPEIPEVN